MKKSIACAFAGLFLFAASLSAASAQALKPADKAALQAAMYQHIDAQLVNGAFLHMNTATGEVRPLAATKAHPMILTMGEHYVLCSSFKTKGGQEVNMDFYMARAGKSYVVFHTEIDNRGPLEKLMDAGKIKMAE